MNGHLASQQGSSRLRYEAYMQLWECRCLHEEMLGTTGPSSRDRPTSTTDLNEIYLMRRSTHLARLNRDSNVDLCKV